MLHWTKFPNNTFFTVETLNDSKLHITKWYDSV